MRVQADSARARLFRARSFIVSTGGRNTIQRSDMTLPGSVTYVYNYGSGINTNMSRLYRVENNFGTPYATYSYNGVNQVVSETEAEAVAFVVCQAIELETPTASSDYIQIFDGKAETLAKSWTVALGSQTRSVWFLPWRGGGLGGGIVAISRHFYVSHVGCLTVWLCTA